MKEKVHDYDHSTQDEVKQTIRFHNILFSKKNEHYEIETEYFSCKII